MIIQAMDITESGRLDVDLLGPSFANPVPARVLLFMTFEKALHIQNPLMGCLTMKAWKS